MTAVAPVADDGRHVDAGAGRRVLRLLMLVSERADDRLREAVREGRRPRPEHLCLQRTHGVELLDWSRISGAADHRSVRLSLRHVLAAVPTLRRYDAVLSDGEHIGIPLALALRSLRIPVGHLMIGHHLTTAAKRRLVPALKPHRGLHRIIVHSSRQLELLVGELGLPAGTVALVRYGVDTAFWQPMPGRDEPLIVAAGSEHRDYATLAAACRDLPVEVQIAAGSLHSPGARQRRPRHWPPNVRVEFADHRALRDLYARARVVAVPLVESDFQAGVTTLLEAMAMGKAVVVTGTTGQVDVVVDGRTAVTVPPGDAPALRAALLRLLADPSERARLGAAARHAVVSGFALEGYAQSLVRHLVEVATRLERRGGDQRH